MASLARADLESLLHTKNLDRTLTRADTGTRAELERAPTGHAGLDARLSGGFPRGQVSELVGPRSSGRTTLTLRLLAAATGRGELVALVDALDMLDVDSAAAAGIDLDRLLWIRGFVVPNPGLCREMNHRALVQAVRALTLVVSAGNFGLVVFDAGDAPADAVRRLPFTTWLRLQRMVEASQTVCLLVGPDRLSRSPRGVSVQASALRAAV
jgi:RecA/RadA recombinase